MLRESWLYTTCIVTLRDQGTHGGITVMERCKWAQTVIPQRKKVLLWSNNIFGSMTGLANRLWSGTPLPFVFYKKKKKKNTWSQVHDYWLEFNSCSQVSDRLRTDWLELNKQILTHYTHAKQDLPPKFELMTSWVSRASISSYWISASSKSPSISNTNASSSWKQTTKWIHTYIHTYTLIWLLHYGAILSWFSRITNIK